MMTLFKKPVEINLEKDGIELTLLKSDFNYNSMLGQDFERANNIFKAWIEEHGGDYEQILEDAGYWEDEE